ncbi:signal peptidase I [Pedobacter sp.]|nr:signal peptidase I [Candidatus Saccharibacteria bacterium]
MTGLAIVGSVVIAIVLNLFVFQSYYVDGESMSPTLHTDNRLIVSKIERTLARLNSTPYIPQRGQIVVLDGSVSPNTVTQAPELIKRVIGIPGDTLTIDNSVVTIKNNAQATFNVDKALELHVDPTYSEGLTVEIPEGKVFVLGDNRTQGGSLDSRVFGLVDTSLIDGRLWARIMPFGERRVF